MYRIYLIADLGGVFPYLTDRDLLKTPRAGASGGVELVASYPTRQQAWNHLMEMPAAWIPSPAPSEA